ncbi:hypothetical protein EZJ19_14815 [Parasulfuritortus cantonensis]|uniref:Uncharacterized protein n=1 Tax=Parasulfuritortus cantonensis TaxID=2528202 RepID=A0A4R1B7E2_9PROT|nr:hypothetical protein [Parasulfuritortus cantonensis]TCJ11683.1 hypothetical protein EZJ19_14815 [Parasulfuritortus cantonensis]
MAGQFPPDVEASVARLVDALRGEAIKFVSADKLPDIRAASLVLERVVDPANGLPGYDGVWRNALNERVGRVTINSDGSFFAEYDLCVRHPRRPEWFIEAVTAWGRGDQVKAEARLLAML